MRVGRYIVIDDTACRIVEIETNKPGKHGAAKMRITAMGIFEGQKKSIILPTTADADIPIIKKDKGQVVSVTDNSAQIMDSVTYEVFDIPITEEFRGKLSAGKEVEIIEAMGRKALARVY